jgi:hypothetical protein
MYGKLAKRSKRVDEFEVARRYRPDESLQCDVAHRDRQALDALASRTGDAIELIVANVLPKLATESSPNGVELGQRIGLAHFVSMRADEEDRRLAIGAHRRLQLSQPE